MSSISVVIAFYNEEDILKTAVERTKKALDMVDLDYEIILVDDGSSDGSLQIAKALADNDHIFLLENIVNLNFGTAVLRGLYFARKEYVIYNAADLPLVPEDIAEILDDMVKKDLQVMVLQREEYKGTIYRKLTSKCNYILLHLLFPKLTRGTPVLNFVQCFRRDSLKGIMPISRSPIFVWPELIFRSKIKNYRWENRMIRVNPNVQKVRKGAFGKPHDVIWGVYEMLRFKIKERKLIKQKNVEKE